MSGKVNTMRALFLISKRVEIVYLKKLETYVGNRLTFKADIVRLNFDVNNSRELIQLKTSHKYTTSN